MKTRSLRSVRERTDVPEEFEYEEFSDKFRKQIIHELGDLKIRSPQFVNRLIYALDIACEYFLREAGKFYFVDNNPRSTYIDYLLVCDVEDLLDFVDFIFGFMDLNYILHSYDLDEYAERINKRFRENNIGYELCDNKIIRKGNEEYYKEVIVPTFGLLKEHGFEGADSELKKAFDLRREGDYESAINEASKAFESTLKTICDNLKYKRDEKDTAQNLVTIIVENGFMEKYNENLLIGVSTLRNKLSGHGKGNKKIAVDEYQADYAINLAAANILFLIELYKTRI